MIHGRTGGLAWTTTGDPALPGMVLLHSLGTDSTMWARQVPTLSGLRRVVAIDLPGHGASEAAAGPYELEELGRDVIDVADAAGLDRFDLCGISIGGLIALWVGISVPDRLASLIACNTAAQLGSEELWSQRIEAVLAEGMESIRAGVVSRFFADGFASRYPLEFARTMRSFAAADPVGYAGCCAALRDSDLRAEVSTITTPTMVIAGEKDLATPPDQARWLHERIAGSRLEVIAGAAHLSNLDRPEEFTRLVVGALEN